MNIDKKKLYILSCAFAGGLLLLCLNLRSAALNLLIAVFATAFFLLFNWLIKKRSIKAIEHRQVTLILSVAALMIVGLYLVTGLGFGLYKNPIQLSCLWKYVLPFIITIIMIENIRHIMLSQENKFSSVMAYVCAVCIDALLLSNGEILKSFDAFNSFLSMALFPSVIANILYHFICKRYGALPNIIYKSIIFIYPFITPIKPLMPEAMLAFAKIIIPLILMAFVSSLYVKRQKRATSKSRMANRVFTVFGIALMAGFIMLISCQFRFGLLVIATESMTGAIDKGDAIIYEQYDDQLIKTGQVLIFEKNGRNTVHRVVDVEKINGQTRIYTKGDANDGMDVGFITESDIVGVLKLKIKYLGYPTVWVRELFK